VVAEAEAEAVVGAEVVEVVTVALVVLRAEEVRARALWVLLVRERSTGNSFPAVSPLLQGSAETGANN